MKTNALLAFFFFFLVALFASTRAEFLRDSEGHLVANRCIYYLLPQGFTGAAIVGSSIENPDGLCSLAVVEKLLHNDGNATIIESKLRSAYITTNYPLQISFHPLPSNPCTEHPEWLVTGDEDFGQNDVMVGDDSEFPYPLSGRLYFKTYDSTRHHYSFVFCFDQYRCGPVAVKTDGYENRSLIVAAEQEFVEPLVLNLVKTSGDHVASHISVVV